MHDFSSSTGLSAVSGFMSRQRRSSAARRLQRSNEEGVTIRLSSSIKYLLCWWLDLRLSSFCCWRRMASREVIRRRLPLTVRRANSALFLQPSWAGCASLNSMLSCAASAFASCSRQSLIVFKFSVSIKILLISFLPIQ